MAAPQVAGAAALLLSIRPELTPAQVRELLCAGADDQVGAPAQDTPGFDIYHGFGRLNVHASLLLASARLEITPEANSVRLSWVAPGNSAIKTPFEIQLADSPAGPWQPVPDSAQITFLEGRASWIDERWETGSPSAWGPRFYRLRVRK
jgi:subtilisin family serine protease